ncbi:uncharacterized protein LOC106133500 isoform X1 [Amyelois transitella]|uniref:uncharacterized protein LOC106133500 isoform X1 n=1 Tax=Amyelois transitella TaxID=680683 RepID=UPI00298F93E9|nr:uncharacterized protein LOC106133500 isoform X1 [Amyelois transitella]
MDVKDLQTEATLGERNNDGSKYATSGVTLPYNRNKSYQDVNSVSLGKEDAPTARPCAVIGPDRVLPQPVSNDTLKKSAFETWYADNVYRHPPEYPHKMPNYHTPIRNISPRQTFQENMQRIMVPPSYNSLKGIDEYNSSMDKNITLSKNTKPNIPIETKYCEVPYSGNPTTNEQKSVRNSELSASNVNPVLTHSAPQGWPSHGRSSRPYGGPEHYQYPDFTNCAGPRPMPMMRPHRSTHEDLSHGYPDPYCHDVRFKPYTVKDRYPQTRYEFIGNYPNPFHPSSSFTPHKYDIQKPLHQPYAYQQVPLKYLDSRIPDHVIDGYHRPTQQTNHHLSFHNQMVHPAYGSVVGNSIQNKFPCPPEGSVQLNKSVTPNKPPYDTNKMYSDYENARSKAFPVPENYYFNEMQRPPHHVKNQVMPNYTMNMHRFPPHPYYTKENSTLKNYEYLHHFRHMDPPMLPHSRISSQFSPNGLTMSPSDTNLSLDNTQIQGNSQEDYGYVSQSPTASIRSMEYPVNSRTANEFYRRYDPRFVPPVRPAQIMVKHNQTCNENSKEKKDIDVRQFLQMWNEVDDENSENLNKEVVNHFPNDGNKSSHQYETIKNQDQLYVLGLVNVPSEELGKYEHIQKVSKLPENIKGYNSIELLNQFEEVIESSRTNNFKSKQCTKESSTYQMSMKNSGSHHSLEMLPRPISPLDVEAKISQSVIHKEVGCNFEIKPCSPKMMNVEAATPIQNVLGERVIEKVSNPLIITKPLMHGDEKLNYDVLKDQDQNKSPNENSNNRSCKMINTQFNSDETMRSNYSLQDLESNSGVCLASLPRLDNDIELNFPEVNQQFINANKGESVITTIKELPSLSLENIANVNLTDNNSKVCQKSNLELPSVIDSEREFPKLSKYRKIKKGGSESLDKETISFSSATQNIRTDSVIIKNPDNPKIYENKEILNMETSYLCDNKDAIKESIDKTDSKDKLLNKVNNDKVCSQVDIAIDFSLNKSYNDEIVSNPINNYIEEQRLEDISKKSDPTKQSQISQSISVHTEQDEDKKHELSTKSLQTIVSNETDTMITDKNEVRLDNSNSDLRISITSKTEGSPQFSKSKIESSLDKGYEFDRNVNHELQSNQELKYSLIKDKGIGIEIETPNLSSIALFTDKTLNVHEIQENDSLIEPQEKDNMNLPYLTLENDMPSTSAVKLNQQVEKTEDELFSEGNIMDNIDTALKSKINTAKELCVTTKTNEVLESENKICEKISNKCSEILNGPGENGKALNDFQNYSENSYDVTSNTIGTENKPLVNHDNEILNDFIKVNKESGFFCKNHKFPESKTMTVETMLETSQNCINSPFISAEGTYEFESSLEHFNEDANPLLNAVDSNQEALLFKTSQKSNNNSLNKISNTSSRADFNICNFDVGDLNKNEGNNCLTKNNITNVSIEENHNETTLKENLTHVIINKHRSLGNKSEHMEIDTVTSNFEKADSLRYGPRTCRLKKELFSPFFRKLVSFIEGPIKPQIVKSCINEQESKVIELKSTGVKNLETKQLTAENHSASIEHAEPINSNIDEEDASANIEITSRNFVCKSLEVSVNETITVQDKNASKNCTKTEISITPADNGTEVEAISAAEVHIYPETSEKNHKTKDSSDEHSTECITVNKNTSSSRSLSSSEHPKYLKISSLPLPSHESQNYESHLPFPTSKSLENSVTYLHSSLTLPSPKSPKSLTNTLPPSLPLPNPGNPENFLSSSMTLPSPKSLANAKLTIPSVQLSSSEISQNPEISFSLALSSAENPIAKNSYESCESTEICQSSPLSSPKSPNRKISSESHENTGFYVSSSLQLSSTENANPKVSLENFENNEISPPSSLPSFYKSPNAKISPAFTSLSSSENFEKTENSLLSSLPLPENKISVSSLLALPSHISPENDGISPHSWLTSHNNGIISNVTTVKKSENNSSNIDNGDGTNTENQKDIESIEETVIDDVIVTSNDVNTVYSLNIETFQNSIDEDVLQNQDKNRPSLKRSLSDSALDSFNDSSDAFYSGWRPKRAKNNVCNLLQSDILFEPNNRRKSIPSIHNEQNVSFCILIDNNCIITEEENEEQDEICFTEISEGCLSTMQDSANECADVLNSHTLELPENFNHEYSETEEVDAEDTWVNDVGCIETVVSEDIAEDITISATSSPERINSSENEESEIFLNCEHANKVKHIYGDKMCNDDVMFLETLYRTPQMNVNKIINRESQESEECIQYYNKDSLEKVLSEPNSIDSLENIPQQTNSHSPLDSNLGKKLQQVDNFDSKNVMLAENPRSLYDTRDKNENNTLLHINENKFTFEKTQDDTVHSCESSIDNVFSYNQKDEFTTYTSSTSPEVSSTTSEERNSGILLKITNYKGSRTSQIKELDQETKSISCKFTELNDYSSSQNFKPNRPLITKAAQKYIPPLEETLGDLKIRLPLPQHSLLRLKQLKLLKEEPKPNKCYTKSKSDIPKKPRPKFEDVLKSIDEIQFKMHKEKSKKSKKSIPKVVIKKNENGSHYASTPNIKPFNPDLTGRKWQPWVFLEKNHFIDKMVIKNKKKAIFNHRKNTYVLAEKFRKYKSIGNAKFVISQPNMHSSSIGHLKCTIRLKHTY